MIKRVQMRIQTPFFYFEFNLSGKHVTINLNSVSGHSETVLQSMSHGKIETANS